MHPMLRCVAGKLWKQAISALCDFTEGWFPKRFWHIVSEKWSNQVKDGLFSFLELFDRLQRHHGRKTWLFYLNYLVCLVIVCIVMCLQ